MRKGDIYNKLCEMIAEMYPSNYRQKHFMPIMPTINQFILILRNIVCSVFEKTEISQ